MGIFVGGFCVRSNQLYWRESETVVELGFVLSGFFY